MCNAAACFASDNIRDFSSKGMWCHYFSLGSGVGVKSYDHKSTAYKTYTFQKIGHALGVSPDCWGLSEYTRIINGNEFTVYAYFTEEVTVLNQVADYQSVLFKIDYYKLESKLNKVIPGFLNYDLNTGNIGITPQGKVVVIDFSHMEIRRNR